MGRKNFIDSYDDVEPDDLAMIGSRLARISVSMQERKQHRSQYDSDALQDRSPKRKSFRPREKMHRDRQP